MNKIVLFDIDYTLFNTDRFRQSNLSDFVLYGEVTQAITQLEKVATLGIFSEGTLELQNEKLHQTNILPHFIEEHIHIVAKKEEGLKTVLHKYRNYKIFLIDDKLTILQKAKNILPELITIWIKRGKYALTQDSIAGFVPWATVDNLSDIIELIAKD